MNNPPVANNDDPYYLRDGTGVTTVPAPGIIANDTETDPGDSIVVYRVQGDTAKVGVEFTMASGRLLTVNADGSFTIKNNNVSISSFPDSFTYTVIDTHGAESNAATVTIQYDT